jgi:hypothetical protein
MYRDEKADPPALVTLVGKTELRYQLRCIEDLHAMLKAGGDWMLLGSADEQKPANPDTVEEWGRSIKNPVKGWYGLKKGLRGRFGMYVPPLLETLGLAEVEHNPKTICGLCNLFSVSSELLSGQSHRHLVELSDLMLTTRLALGEGVQEVIKDKSDPILLRK